MKKAALPILVGHYQTDLHVAVPENNDDGFIPMAWGKQQSFFEAAARFSCISVELSSCRNLGLPEGVSACQEGGSWWRLGRGYPKRVPRCQGKAAWENLALSQFCEQEKPEAERKRRVRADFPSQEGCRGGWWQGPATTRPPVATTLPWGSLGCPGEPSLSSTLGANWYHGANGYVAVLILPILTSFFQPLCEFSYIYVAVFFFFCFFFNKRC